MHISSRRGDVPAGRQPRPVPGAGHTAPEGHQAPAGAVRDPRLPGGRLRRARSRLIPLGRGAPVEQSTVLVVDDEPRVLDALEAILAAEFRVLRADGGEAALRLLEAEEVAVIVTDYRMPGMSGVELLRRSQDRAPDT